MRQKTTIGSDRRFVCVFLLTPRGTLWLWKASARQKTTTRISELNPTPGLALAFTSLYQLAILFGFSDGESSVGAVSMAHVQSLLNLHSDNWITVRRKHGVEGLEEWESLHGALSDVVALCVALLRKLLFGANRFAAYSGGGLDVTQGVFANLGFRWEYQCGCRYWGCSLKCKDTGDHGATCLY